MWQPQYINVLILTNPEDQKVPPLAAMPSNMQGANARLNLVARSGAQNIRAILQ